MKTIEKILTAVLFGALGLYTTIVFLMEVAK